VNCWRTLVLTSAAGMFLAVCPSRSVALDMGPVEVLHANGADIAVPGYSVPSFEDWNNDGLKDLIVGEGGGPSSAPGKVRIYLNVGTQAQPQFKDYFYAKSKGADLVCTPMACLGCFPRLVNWNGHGCKDLLVGQSDGTVRIFSSIAGPNDMPTFDGGPKITVTGGADLNVGPRATPSLVDWNKDGLPDLVAGTIDGSIHLFINHASSAGAPPTFSPSAAAGQLVQEKGRNLVVPDQRSSPVVVDLDGDGKKDILTGDTNGHLLLYKNVGTDAAPAFSGSSAVTSKGATIQLGAGTRSRPFVCHWTGAKEGPWDILVGAADGKVRLYRGQTERK
jgi:large repetitive protein